MKALCFALGLGVLVAGASAPAKAQEADDRENPTLCVGVFDSRALVTAYAHSKPFGEELRKMKEELAQARAEGDESRAEALEAAGHALQERFHRQGFSTAPVDDILDRIREQLPQVAEEAGVDLIVSKWRVAYRNPAAEVVDVTDELVLLFDPDEKALETISEMRNVEPLPLYGTDWEAMSDH